MVEPSVESEEFGADEKEQTALRMMQKFGFKVGSGLGRQGQGIKTPLIVKKTNDTSGVITPSEISLNALIPHETSCKNALTAHNVEVSRVIVLMGLSHLEELENGVEEEIRQECESLGATK